MMIMNYELRNIDLPYSRIILESSGHLATRAQPLSTIRLKAVKLGKNKKETIDLFKNFENFLKKMTDDEFIKFAKRTIKKGIK